MVDALFLDETDVVGQRVRLVGDAGFFVTTSLINVDDDDDDDDDNNNNSNYNVA